MKEVHLDPRGFAKQITSGCLMGRTRYLARVLTGIYDDEVRPFGVQASQVTSLAVIAVNGPVRRAEIGRWLHFDSSTLTRNLRVMLANGWIEEAVEERDGRGSPLRITAAGAALLSDLGPAWQKAQERAAQLLGEQGRSAVLSLFDKFHGIGVG
jgi:DNA-binding MarR family transcriptional regulator